jgi:hypothetical protein
VSFDHKSFGADALKLVSRSEHVAACLFQALPFGEFGVILGVPRASLVGEKDDEVDAVVGDEPDERITDRHVLAEDGSPEASARR